MKYLQFFTIGFSVITTEEDGEKVTADELWKGLRKMVSELDGDEILLAAIWHPEVSEPADDV